MLSCMLALLCGTVHLVDAQIMVTNSPPYNNPDHLVQNVLLGPGVPFLPSFPPASNSVQIGKFTNGNSFGFGIDSGIVMISGNALDAMPGGPIGTAFGPTPDPDLVNMLTSINSTSTVVNDGAFIEFDFVATGDSVSFNYIFASYEYTDFTCSSFNDPFGFFLTGAGINGVPGITTVNLAQVPGTFPPVPVAVNTLNQGFPSGGYPASTCQAANPNFTSSAAWYVAHPMANNVNATGYSLPLRAGAQVTCGNLYHIKLAVADVLDQNYHSMTFLEARSFNVPTVQFSTSTNHNNSFTDTLLVEGCNAGYLLVEKQGNVSQPLTIHYNLSGTATEGLDFAFLPDSIHLPSGVRMDSVPILTFDDGIAEGLETIVIDAAQIVSPCYAYSPQQIVFTIRDRQPVQASVSLLQGTDTLDCPNTAVQLSAQFSGGEGQLSGAWEDGSTQATRWDTVSTDRTYIFYAWDECAADSVVDSLRLYVRPLSPLVLQTDSSWACPGDSVSLSISYSGGAPPYVFSWWDGNTDPNRRFPSDSSFRPAFQLVDACGQFARDTAVVHIADQVVASFAALEDPASTLSIQISNYSRNGVQFFWDLGDGNSSAVSQPKHTYSRAGTYIIQLRTTDRLGCSDTSWQTIEIRQEYSLFVPTAFTPNGDQINDLFVIQGSGIRSYVFRVFNRWGEQIFRSGSITHSWDGTFNGAPVPEGVYYFAIELELEDGGTHAEQGSIHLHR